MHSRVTSNHDQERVFGMEITRRLRLTTVCIALFLLFFLNTGAVRVQAQDEDTATEEPTIEDTAAVAPAGGPPSLLLVTATDSNSIPIVGIRMVGIGSDGRAINPETDAVTVRHNGEIVPVDETGTESVGTLTIFLLDLTPGVEAQIPAVQSLIENYAGGQYMTEQVDYVAIYRAGDSSAVQLMAPDRFFNSVRNFFVNPLEPQAELTALVDSTLGLLEEVDGLKPDPEMVASIVIISDGTDAVSDGDPASVASRAAELGIPLQTVWLQNANLTAEQQTAGQTYLSSLATDSRGRFAEMSNTEAQAEMLSQIGAFRDHWWLYYTVPDLAGGTFPVGLSLLHEAEVTAETSVTIAGSTPSVSLDIPEDSRALSLPGLEEPVTLSFSAEVTWLDGVEREVVEAQLLVNGEVVRTVEPNELNNFEADIENLVFGNNTIQVAVADEQELEARSPLITLIVTEGAQQIPEPLEPSFPWVQAAIYCLVILAVVAAIAGLAFLFLSRRGLIRTGRGRRQPAPVITGSEPPAAAATALPTEMYTRDPEVPAGPPPPTAYLEVIQAESKVAPQQRLVGPHTRLGRSPEQADIVFEKDITVSRLHALITWDGEMYHIYDEKSTSGTWVNDQQVVDFGLQILNGDEIYLGKVVLRFVVP